MSNAINELLKNAKTDEEAKQILDGCKDELNDAELDDVAGGIKIIVIKE